eukprot:TRINITY_DN848_c0_g1_i9.p1 TRINITY_DN848_c0_g1~~TRINITY_DN848_c0_g1_i9.p1  ORF type:complete len:1077 (-),score=283.36 TRINITY_DN848_c0_g1_i9:1241-4471(-)
MMKIKYYTINLVLSLLAFCSAISFAEDIDLYVNHNVELDEKPRVLLIFDTSGSMAFSTKTGNDCGYNNYTNRYTLCSDSRLGVAKNAMTQLVNDNADIDFGLMRFNALNGGYVLAGIGSSATQVKNAINNLPADGGTPLTETLWEAYLYITGQSVHYGQQVDDSLRDTSVENKVNDRKQVEECDWERKGWRWVWVCKNVWVDNFSYTYISPFADSVAEAKRCDNSINIIYMTDGDPSAGDDNEMDNKISGQHNHHFDRYLNGDDAINNNYLHQLAKVLHGTKDAEVDLFPATTNIKETGRVYTIGFGTGMSENGKKLLEETAKLGGGGKSLHANTADQLSKALKNTITRIREVNASFTSPAVASNNADQTRSRDAIYYAMFYPETGARWRGNLKKLKVSGDQIIDSALNPALNTDGLIKKEAKTFWLAENAPADGNSVQNGGVNAMLAEQTPSTRQLFTDAGTSGLIAFNKNAVVNALGGETEAAELFAVSRSELANTINWARGVDVDNENTGNVQRDDIFGDPLHSKPVAIDYGNGDVRILIGTNAGFLHMFKDSGNTVSESWGFIPSSLYKIIDPIRRNQANTKLYGVDGPISVYFDDKNRDGVVNGSDRVWAFFGLRRGGNYYYGLDITNPNLPRMMWGGPIQGGSGDFKELAQSWSKPTVSYINLKNYKNRPVLVFGAGYDTNKDNVTRSDDTKGRGIYVVDAQTGVKVWSLTPANGFNGKHSIAADIVLLDSNYDGFIDRMYATDTGGDVWRVDMPTENPTDGQQPWTHFKLAELGGSTATQDRRFFYKPMVARTMFSKVTETTINGKTVITRQDTPYDAVLIGSGNRSKPTATTVQDQLYMIRDINTVSRSFISNNTPAAITTNKLMNMNADPFGNALDDVDKFTQLEVELGKFNGWYYSLPASGEKSLAAATVIGGVAYFTSYTPASDTATANQCSLSGGNGSMYAFHLHYGTKVYEQLRFITSHEVPDTAQLYFGEGPTCADNNGDGKCDDTDEDVKKQSQFLLIGPGVKLGDGNAKNPFVPKEILGPGITVGEDGKIKLVSDATPIGFGFKTQQTYIYKREMNDNQK